MAKKQKKEGKHKPKKMSKSDVKEKSYLFFNDLDFKSMTPESLIESVYTTATTILAEHGMDVNVWCTFDHLEKHVAEKWDADKDFIRFWLDRLISEFGYMIWNELYRKYFKEDWHQHGILHEVPELPKKLRANPEAVAGHFADSAVTKYEEHYK